MYKATLRKLVGGERLRTDIIEGTCEDYPRIGESFVIESESFVIPGGIRRVNTSMIQDISKSGDGSLIIKTLNSTYQITIE